MSMTIDINDFSNGSIDSSNPQDPKWVGTGVFDVIMKAANENIKIQNQTSRITGAEYAEVYLGTMQSAISEAMKFLLNKEQIIKDLELKQTQINTTEEERRLKSAQADAYPLQAIKDLDLKQANIDLTEQQKSSLIKDEEVKQANIELLNRQKEGFDDNKHQKLFEAQMNAWALMFSSGLLTTQPSIISNDSASALYNTLKP